MSVAEVSTSLRAHGRHYLRRVYTSRETAVVPDDSSGHGPGHTFDRTAAYLAGRFAAKEAVYKALRYPRSQPLPWTDIEVLADDEGWPQVRLHGRARTHAEATDVTSVEVSITHDGDSAVAVAIAHRPPRDVAVTHEDLRGDITP